MQETDFNGSLNKSHSCSLSINVFLYQALVEVQEELQKGLGREPTEGELANATNMNVIQVRRQLEVGRAARNKLIKVRVTSFPQLKHHCFRLP